MPRRSFRCAALLAWRNLTQSRLRLISSVAGTAFAVTLMFLENGFRDALLNSMTAVIRHLDGELVIISKRLYTLGVPMPFPARRLDLAAGFAFGAGFALVARPVSLRRTARAFFFA